ncbi:undecaprenyl-phosphate galactose phosphotransferase, partial [Candidatus Magnetobacterium bavaricum]
MTAKRQFVIHLVRVFFLVCLDVLAFYTSLFAAWYVRDVLLPLVFSGLTENFAFGMYVGLWWVPVTYVSFNAYTGMYSARLPFWDDTRRLITSLTQIVLVAVECLYDILEG